MLREYIISEAMHALGIPTTRSLAVVTTGEPVYRESELEGAVLTRVAASHIRVGTMQWAAAHEDVEALRALADYTRARHYPELARCTPEPHLALLDAIIERQARLIARWQLVGFIHGVMNTDNMALSGETIDYGPCAFMDAYDPETVFSSIDHAGRYAYGNQPPIAQWNLARLAEAMLPLLDADIDRAVAARDGVARAISGAVRASGWLAGMRAKLGLFTQEADDKALVDDLLAWMQRTSADFTNTFRDAVDQRRARGGEEGGSGVRRLAPPAGRAPRAAAAVARRSRGPDAPAQSGVHPAQSHGRGGAAGGECRRLLGDAAAARRARDTLRSRPRPAGVQRARRAVEDLPDVLRDLTDAGRPGSCEPSGMTNTPIPQPPDTSPMPSPELTPDPNPPQPPLPLPKPPKVRG